MRTAYCPKTHTQLTSVSVCRPYGHVPGHYYADVDVIVSRYNGSFRCHVVESWGSAQGYDQELGRTAVIGRGLTIADACSKALRAGRKADIDEKRLIQAISQAQDLAEESLEQEEGGS